jgi:ABC-2 type transport system permease protein
MVRSRIIIAMVRKELQELSKNPATISVILIPILITAILSVVAGSKLVSFAIIFPLTMMSLFAVSTFICDEKEHRTLEALLTSPATFQEIVLGKLLVGQVISFLSVTSLVLAFHFSSISLVPSLLTIFVGSVIMVLFGMVIGLLAPNQAFLGGIGSFILMFFMLPELLSPIHKYVGVIARALPIHSIVRLVDHSDLYTLGEQSGYILFLLLFLLAALLMGHSFVKSALTQEDYRWRFDCHNWWVLGGMLSVMVASSVCLEPARGEFNTKQHYFHRDYQISFPIDRERYLFREVDQRVMYRAIFTSKDRESSYLFFKVKRMEAPSLAIKLKSYKEGKQYQNLKVTEGEIKGQPYLLATFIDDDGVNFIYSFVRGLELIQVGLVTGGSTKHHQDDLAQLSQIIERISWSI